MLEASSGTLDAAAAAVNTEEALRLHDALDTWTCRSSWANGVAKNSPPATRSMARSPPTGGMANASTAPRSPSARLPHLAWTHFWWVAPGIPLLLRFPALKTGLAPRLVRCVLPLFATRRARAHLRMTSHRGRITATMIYDGLPIHDVFRKLDPDTVLGLMDRKGLAQPLFFLLRRQPG